MFNHGSFNPRPGQGPQAPRPPPYLQHLPAPPPLPHNFQHGPLRPPSQVLSRPGQPALHIYQHGPLGSHLAVRQPGGLPNRGQPFLHPQPTIHGNATLPLMYTTSQQNQQHSPYLTSGPSPPPGSLNMEILQAPYLVPTPSSGYNAPTHQLPQQPTGMQGLQQIPPHPPASSFSTSSLAPPLLPPPPPPAYSSPPPIPPSSPPPVSSTVLKSVPLPSGSNLPCHSGPHSNKLSGYKSGDPGPATEVKPSNCGEHSIYLGGDGLPSKRIVACGVPRPPAKPAEEKTVEKIEELCQNIAKNGSSYEDMVRLKESGNPEFKFLFGGKPRSEDTIAHGYFLWMKKQCLLTNKLDVIEPAVPTKQLMVAGAPHSPVDSDMDMEMEDDITTSDKDQSVNQPVEGPPQASDPISSEFDTNKQLCKMSAGSEADKTVLSDQVLLSGSSGLCERVFRAQNPVTSSAGAVEFPFSGDTVTSLTPLGNDDKSSSNDAAAAKCLNSDKYVGQVMKGSSPFRLLQDYDSNENSEIGEDPCPKDVNPETVSPLLAAGTKNLHRDTGFNLKMDMDAGSKSSYETKKGFGQLSESGMSYGAPECSSDPKREVKEIIPTSIASWLTSELIDAKHENQYAKHENQSSIDHTASPKALLKEEALEGAQAKVALSGKYDKENGNESMRLTSNLQKIDKFGRLVKEGASDSESDNSLHAHRSNKRGRSRSRSPVDRRRRRGRRSPWRRREKRSRSRSWSPRNRRSRSRSPSFRHGGEFSSGNMRRGKVQMPECFDFLRGRCYRGASCRYMHHDSEKSDASRHCRSKQQHEQLHPSTKNFYTLEDNKILSLKVTDHEQEVVNGETKHNYVMLASSSCDAKNGTFVHNREDSLCCDILVDSEIIRSDSSGKVAAKLPETKIVKERFEDVKALVDESDRPTVVDSLPSKPAADANFLKLQGEASGNVLSSMKESVIHQPQSILPDPVLESAEQTDDSSVPLSSSYATLPLLPSLLPPPGPTVNVGTAQPGVIQFEQSCLHPRSDFGSQTFSRPFSIASSSNSQVVEFKHHGYPPVQDPRQPLLHAEDFWLKPLPGSNPSGQQFGGTNFVGPDQLRLFPMRDLSASDSSTRSNIHPQSISFSQEAPATIIQSFSDDNLHPPGERLKSSSQIHPYLQPNPPYVFHHSVPDRVCALPDKISSSSGYLPDFEDKNQSLNLPDFGVYRNSTHFNPYASTFEKPLISRFSSDVFRQETTDASKQGHPLILDHNSVNGQGVGLTARLDQYDPLFDSIEPSSNSRKSNHIQKWEPSGDSDVMLNLKGLNQPLDVEENNKKEISGIALATSLDNEEFGETADEAGDVENGSQSNPNDLANTNMGEMEIDQIKLSGKSKKGKEYRSMKLFKACLADFVKEVLKPSWRQGNMSKETFKTVVKKTVDKVSGAMKSHQMPKSKAKINQYIDSSQRKLTKLVMGYVDKYAKG